MNVKISEQLPLLAATPNGIRKLRELILELAVRGKLVTQNPEDGLANELLKRITVERKRQTSEGRKPKSLEAIGEEEKPFSIPSQWVWIRLGSCLEMINGRAFKPADWKTLGLPIVRIQNLNRADALFNYCDENAVDDRHVIDDGTLLISWSGTPGTSFGAFIWNRGKAALNQHIFSCLQIGDAFFDRFLKIAINTRLEELIAKAHGGVGLQHVTKGKLEALTLVLPPLAEQHRIVAKVDELMALCDRLEAQQAGAESAHAQLVTTLLDSLTQANDADDFAASWQRLSAHFHTLFTTESSIDALKQTLLQLAVMGKLVPQSRKETAVEQRSKVEAPFRVPDSWIWSRFDSAWESSFYGPRFGKDSYVASNGMPTIRTTDMTADGLVQLRNPPQVNVPAEKAGLYRLKHGDLLVTRSGSIGTAALFLLEIDAIPSAYLIRIRFQPSLVPRFGLIYLRSPLGQNLLGLNTTSVGVPNVSATKMAAFPLPLPPTGEQHRIVAKVDELMVLCDKLTAAIQRRNQHSRLLADALVDKALSPASRTDVNVVDLSCYLVDRLVAKPTFGRTTHMKLIYLADTYLGFDFQGEYVREAAGPLDKNIYKVEKQAEANGWYTHSENALKSGKPKVTYQATHALAAKAQKVAEKLGDRRQDVDRLIVLLGDRKTDDVQIIATLFAAWNDALLDGQSPSDDWIIREVRENWHIEKQRFTPDQLRHWLDWMRQNQLVPTGKLPHTQQQTQMFQ